MNKSKSPASSKVYKTEVVCPNDTNPLGILQGGRLVQWMDVAAAVCAQNHAGRISVTASIDTVSFKRPVQVGDVLYIMAMITRAFTTSMEIRVSVWSKNIQEKKKHEVSESFFTFVALDENGKATAIPGVKPRTNSEVELYNKALKRKNTKHTS